MSTRSVFLQCTLENGAFRSPKFNGAIRSVSKCVNGSRRPSFFHERDCFGVCFLSNKALADGELNRSVSRAVSTAAYGSTNSAFASSTFRHFSSIISSVRTPLRIAALIFSRRLPRFPGITEYRFLLLSASTSASPGVLPLVTPFMFMASVKHRPSKCNFLRSRSVMICLDREAGILAVS